MGQKSFGCFQYIKGTKKKANHNMLPRLEVHHFVVSNTSKVLKRKQITTIHIKSIRDRSCFQYIKGTKKKANHNAREDEVKKGMLFPIHQRY